MLIRPMASNTDVPVKESNFKANTFRNDVYVCPVDSGFDPITGQLIYDVVLISEIIGDIPGANEFDPWDVDNLGKVFGKIVHHFTGRISEGNVDMSNPKEVFANMSLVPIVSYVTSFKDMDVVFGATQFYRYDTYRYTSMVYKLQREAKFDLDKVREMVKHTLKLDIPNPLYPALRNFNESYITAEQAIKSRLTECINSYRGYEFSENINNLKIHMVEIDFAAEERAKVERNNSIRALLGSPADDSGENDPLVDRITLGNLARNIAVDFMKADLGGMMESCTLIFDNKHMHSSGLYCGFKSVVSPFGELYPVFNTLKSRYIASEFDKICKNAVGISTPRHYRITLDSNQYEITVKMSILDENDPQKMFGLYDFKKSVTIKMKKSEAILDFVTQYLHTQQMLKEYYK